MLGTNLSVHWDVLLGALVCTAACGRDVAERMDPCVAKDKFWIYKFTDVYTSSLKAHPGTNQAAVPEQVWLEGGNAWALQCM